MSEKENKFILGDNSDGYRRSTENSDTFPFSIPREKPASERPRPVRPSARPSSVQPARRTASRQTASPRKKTGQARQPQQEGQALSANERRKRHNELRRKQRRRKQLLTYAAVAVAIVGVALLLSLTVFFQINEITVKGNSPYTQEQIIGASGLEMGENIILCGADKVSDNLSKSLPYIGSATVERSASGKVVINVKTTSPKWSFINGEQAVLIDKNGKVLEIGTSEKALEATIVQGAVVANAIPGEIISLGDDIPFSLVDELGKAFEKAGISTLTTVNLSDVDYIQALYDGRLNLIIGSMTGIDMKLALAAKVIERENEIDPDQYGTLDLTVDNKVYFRPEENPNDYYGGEEDASEPVQDEGSSQPSNE